MSALQNLYQKARAETAKILGYKLARLTPEQTMRLDCVVALRLALDDMQGRIVRGETVDVAKMLTASEALAKLLPPQVLASPPARDDVDPWQKMIDIYTDMRARGELAEKINPNSSANRVRELEAKVAELEGEVERLRGAAPVPELVNVVPMKPKSKPTPAPAPAAGYDYTANQDWKRYVGADGTISSTPCGSGPGEPWWGKLV
jgi:hypothetical protein